MAKFLVHTPIQCNGKRYEPGQVAEFDDKDTPQLLAAQAISPAPENATKKKDK